MDEHINIEEYPEDLQESICLIVSQEDIKQEPEADFVNINFDNRDEKSFIIEEYHEVGNQYEAISHPSIGNTREEFLDRLVGTKNCYLCSSDVLASSLQSHFIKKHLDNSLIVDGKLIIQCRLGCKKAAHYHCPQLDCLFSCKYRHNLKVHYSSHSLTDNSLAKHHSDLKFEIKQEEEDDMPEVNDGIVLEETEIDFMKIPSEKPSIAFTQKELVERLKPLSCYLCQNAQFISMARLRKHFAMLHIKNLVQIGKYVILPCKLACNKIKTCHYHCPYQYCTDIFNNKQKLNNHFPIHFDAVQVEEGPNSLYDKLSINYEMKRLNIPQPKKTFDLNGINYYPHDSVKANAIELYDLLCLPYCYLCADSSVFYSMSRLERHFKNAHMNRAVDCGSCYLVQCGQNCFSEGKLRKHYHCPFCTTKDPRRGAFWVHLESHRRLCSSENVSKVATYKGIEGINIKQIPSTDITNDSPEITISLSEGNGTESSILRVESASDTWNEVYEGIPVNKHPSISLSEDNVLALADLPHCYLCNDDKDYISKRRLSTHIFRVHIKALFKMGQIKILLCKKYCGEKHQDKGHYHCLFCEFTGRQKERVQIHIQKHITTIKKRKETAEYHVPEVLQQDHTVPDDWILEENKEEVRHWEQNFNSFVSDIYCKKAKTNNNVVSQRKKSLIYNHLKLNMDVEDKSLKYWVKFRGIKVISCSQLNLENVLVSPLTKYNNDELNRVINVQPVPQQEGSDLILRSNNPSEEFFKSYRLIPTREELFKILFQIHIMNGYHPAPKTMFGEIRRKYLYFPRALVEKFVSMCPSCCVHYPDPAFRIKNVEVSNGDSVNLAGLQVTVVDMSEHPDGKYNYVIECFDRCSRLTWLYPAERAVSADLAESVIRSVLCITGLPAYIITNCGIEFLEEMLQEIDKRWFGSCSALIEKTREAAHILPLISSDELMEALQELVMLQPSSWASALPHLQYHLNHTRGHGNHDHSSFELVFGKQRSRPNWQRYLTSAGASSQTSNGDAISSRSNLIQQQKNLMLVCDSDHEDEDNDDEDYVM